LGYGVHMNIHAARSPPAHPDTAPAARQVDSESFLYMPSNKRANLRDASPSTPRRKARRMDVQQYKRLLTRFLVAKRAANRSVSTVDWYERQISAFLLWAEMTCPP
jgi:hypothetical protein